MTNQNKRTRPSKRTIAMNIDFVRDCAHRAMLGELKLTEEFLTAYGYIEDNIPELFPILDEVYHLFSELANPEKVLRDQAWWKLFDIDDKCDEIAKELL